MAAVAHAQIVRAQHRAYGYASVAIVALVALVPAFQYAHGQATSSGLYDYLSLFISDSAYVFSNLKTSLFSIMESVPVGGAVLVLMALFAAAYTATKARSFLRMARLSMFA
jgi:hypothetical protein